MNFYGCKSVNLLTTSVPYTVDGGGELLLYIVFMFIFISCKHMDVLEYPAKQQGGTFPMIPLSLTWSSQVLSYKLIYLNVIQEDILKQGGDSEEVLNVF